jgi:aspartyl-tRNA(Asn)/glutamyl-tRNA(Gln) amidotransferase subunit A
MRETVLIRERLEAALERIRDPAGEGARAFLTVYADSARAEADAADRRARECSGLGPLDGIIVSIKDLFDVAGEPTRASSRILEDSAPAKEDAAAVRRLREAGAVIVGKTSMSEFAFTGVGANPHYGTPGNPADRGRVPGGSSSGAAVAVADGMCEISIGTDTGGSTRIPAALCGVVGFKPSKYRVPTDGAFPLSHTLDSVGPIARSVEDCAKADAVLAAEEPWPLQPYPLDGLKLGIASGLPLGDLDATVSSKFMAALSAVGGANAQLSDVETPLFDDMRDVNSTATIATVEAYELHRERLATRGDEMDPFIRARIEMGRAVSPSDYQEMLEARARLAAAMDSLLAGFDALVLPTTPIVAPTTAEISSVDAFRRANRLLLRNTEIANFFDLCAISLPMPGEGLPAGFMLFGRRGADRKLFRIAAAVEKLLS